VEQVYTAFLPKGGHPFIYISVLIEPQRVDVNIHPTKREVGFLNEEEIIENLSIAIRTKLGEGDSSRRFIVQTLLPGAKPVESQVLDTQGKKAYSNYLVRTDPQTRKITSMFTSEAANVSESQGSEVDYEIIPKERIVIKLGSVRDLREEIMEVAHNGISRAFKANERIDRVVCKSHICWDSRWMETSCCRSAWG
jgi:DNA mismatch repair protein MLH1